jgi:hypothetical protein
VRLKNLTRYAMVAGALATPLAFIAPAGATTGGNSAFGISASGLVSIPQTPAVSSSAQPNDKSLLALPANPLVDLKVLHVTAKPAYARASVTDLKIAKVALSAHLVTAKCTGGKGSSHLVKATLGGHRLAVDAAPNSSVAVPVEGVGTVSVVLNKQIRNADGGITVTAIELSVPPIGPVKGQTVSVSAVTCGNGNGDPGDPGNPGQPPGKPGGPTGTPTPAPSTSPSEAPAPTPVNGDLPVTG